MRVHGLLITMEHGVNVVPPLFRFIVARRVEWDVFARGSSHYTGPSVSLPGGRLRFSVAIYQSALLNSSTSNMADDTGNSIPPPSSPCTVSTLEW